MIKKSVSSFLHTEHTVSIVMESEILESAIRDLERSHEDRMARKLLIKDVDRKVLERVSSYAWEQLHLGT